MSDASLDDEVEPEVVLDAPTVTLLHGLYERDGKLTAESVLTEATDPASPLHGRFEWDDTVAAHAYRLSQARHLCRALIVVENRPVRAFVFVPSAGGYAPLREAMDRPDWRAEVLGRFARDAEAFRRRWENHHHAAQAYALWVVEEAARLAAE